MKIFFAIFGDIVHGEKVYLSFARDLRVYFDHLFGPTNPRFRGDSRNVAPPVAWFHMLGGVDQKMKA